MPLPQVTTLLPAGDATAIPSISPACAQACCLFAQVIHKLVHRKEDHQAFAGGAAVANRRAGASTARANLT